MTSVVLSRNLSASGFCFKSGRPVNAGQTLLIHLGESVLEELRVNRARVMKLGNYVLARVIWSKPITDRSEPYYEIGASFIPIGEGDPSCMDLFTSLLNHDAARTLGVNSIFSSL